MQITQIGTAGYSALLKIDGKLSVHEFSTKKALDIAVKVTEPYNLVITKVGSNVWTSQR